MKTSTLPAPDDLLHAVRLHLFSTAAGTGSVPQAAVIASALDRPIEAVRAALKQLGAAKVLILAPHDGDIWAANPFCAVPSGFRAEVNGQSYWAICVWDALGIVAALGAPAARITAPCGDCGEPIELRVANGELVTHEGVVHFAVPARNWWSNIGFA